MSHHFKYWSEFKHPYARSDTQKTYFAKVKTKSLSGTLRYCLNTLKFNTIDVVPNNTLGKSSGFTLVFTGGGKKARISINVALLNGSINTDIEDALWSELAVAESSCEADPRKDVLYSFDGNHCNVKIPALNRASKYEKILRDYARSRATARTATDIKQTNMNISNANIDNTNINNTNILNTVLSCKYSGDNEFGVANSRNRGDTISEIKATMSDLDHIVSTVNIDPDNLIDMVGTHDSIPKICTYYKGLINKLEVQMQDEMKIGLNTMAWAIQTDPTYQKLGQAYDMYNNRDTWKKIASLVVIGDSTKQAVADDSKTPIRFEDFVKVATTHLGNLKRLPLFYNSGNQNPEKYPEVMGNTNRILPLETMSMSMHVLYVFVFEEYHNQKTYT